MRFFDKSEEGLAGDATARACRAFRRVLGGFTLVMLGLSWPLWVETPDFPRVPFVRGLPLATGAAAWCVFGLLLAAVALVTLGVAWRAAAGLSAVVLAFLIAQDQHRFQPWAYQYGMAALALAACRPAKALGLCRLFVVALYLHSGLSKLDVSFCNELGLSFLSVALRPLGLDPTRWALSARTGAVLLMPAWEIAVAVGLCVPRFRRVAITGAVLIHLALLGILAPWGLNQSTIVLVWNAAMIGEVLVLFGSITTEPNPPAPQAPGREPGLEAIVRLMFVLAAVMPLGERMGIWDTWPSFALYASHAERTDILVHEDDLAAWPESIGRHAAQDVGGGWRRLNLTAWSRAARGVPVYPQGRACLGLAEALAARYHGAHPLGVVLWSRADLLSGRRMRTEAWGDDAIRREAGRFRLNARPAPWPRPP